MVKSIFSSWTIWFGILQLALGVVGLFSGLMGSAESMTLITTGFATIGLRIKTTTPVGLTSQSDLV